MKKIFALLAIILLMLTSCSSKGEVMNMSSADFAKKIHEPGIVVLDVRTPEEFSGPHIHGALNIDFEAGNFKEKISHLDKSATYAVYCRSGRRSALAIETMKEVGFTSLVNLSDGINDWTSNGFPVENS